MKYDEWLNRGVAEYVSIPDPPPRDLVGELLDVIDMMNVYPNPEQVAALRRLARAIREESKD